MIVDKRATLQVRIAINRILKNKNSINTVLAKLITEFSHSTIVEKAFIFQACVPPRFYCIQKVHSPFWCTAVPMPSRISFYQSLDLVGTNFGRLHFIPDWIRAGNFGKKRLFDPFHHPYIKCRNKKFFLKQYYK